MRFSLSTPLFAAALATLPFCTAAPANSITSYDAVIIGGGLAGLSAAKTLAAANKTYIVLEARNRTGGRVENANVPGGGITEVGAEFIGEYQNYALNLAKELGLELYEAYNKGKNVYYINGKRSLTSAQSLFGQSIPGVDPYSVLQLFDTQSDIDDMAKTINLKQPWKSPKAAAWDKQTFGAWLDGRGLTKAARAVMETATSSIWSVTSYELSLLYAMTYVAGAGDEKHKGNFERLTSVGGEGAQRYRVVGGTELLASKLADRLGHEHILLGAPVQSVVKKGGANEQYYTTTLRNGSAFASRTVIVAMSPPVADLITYDPPLPASRTQLCQRMKMGRIGKVITTYKTPFWRKAGLTGQAVSSTGTTRATFDQSLEDGSFYGIMGFVEADEMRDFDAAPVDELTASVTKDLVNYFGPQAANATSYVVKRWDLEEFSRGGPVAVAGPGILTEVGSALRDPVDGIHFAGTESATYWIGYMTGAIESGDRAAKEVIAKV
ncbi:hypothetical protein OC834_006912 [Tilletia horrida]|nr:hypothetical protein OC834_006912 [Tilletia horrida]